MDSTTSSGITVSQTDPPPVVSTSSLNAVRSMVLLRLSQEEISQIALVVAGIIHPFSTSVPVSNPLMAGNEASIAMASNQSAFTQVSTLLSTDTGTENAG